ncbi:hypothetical protein NDN08_007808 [Rhodosorus marinus]|uniref:RING-type domain-containing protein n=1 Tax=Rhodosorus marinus TaxID=101924 RepID=A0AAV8V2T3_9RHOD|nr:hypothetical protein NDN08_007808 [Rhodosorus marinus]
MKIDDLGATTCVTADKQIVSFGCWICNGKLSGKVVCPQCGHAVHAVCWATRRRTKGLKCHICLGQAEKVVTVHGFYACDSESGNNTDPTETFDVVAVDNRGGADLFQDYKSVFRETMTRLRKAVALCQYTTNMVDELSRGYKRESRRNKALRIRQRSVLDGQRRALISARKQLQVLDRSLTADIVHLRDEGQRYLSECCSLDVLIQESKLRIEEREKAMSFPREKLQAQKKSIAQVKKREEQYQNAVDQAKKSISALKRQFEKETRRRQQT